MGTPGKVASAAAMAPPPPSPGKPTTLLDVQEVEWITRELERLLVREASGAGDMILHRRKRAKVMSSPHAAPKPSQASKKGGFLAELLGKHAVSVCGDGAVLPSGRGGRRRRGRGGTFREVDKQQV